MTAFTGELSSLAQFKDAYFLSEEEVLLIREKSKQLPQDALDKAIEQLAYSLERGPFSSHYPDFLKVHIHQRKEQIINSYSLHVLTDNFVEEQSKIRLDILQRGVSLEAFIRLLAQLHEIFFNILREHYPQDIDLLIAYKKFNQIDLNILAREYRHKMVYELQQQNEALRELSTPIAQIWQGILLLPLVGFIDSHRAQEIMGNMLQQIAEKSAEVFILDISGVVTVDTAVANYLIKMTHAAKLMGTECIISGISPYVAQTMVELGIDIEQIHTTASMQDALKQAIQTSHHELITK